MCLGKPAPATGGSKAQKTLGKGKSSNKMENKKGTKVKETEVANQKTKDSPVEKRELKTAESSL